jgi:putative membrane protein
MGRPAVLALSLSLILPAIAWADGARVSPSDWPSAWNWDPLVLLCLGSLAWLYARGLARLSTAGAATGAHRGRAACFYGGLLVVFFALLSPVDAVGEDLSFVHMVQHMLLMNVAAPLFVAGSPTFVLAWGLPEGRRGWSRTLYVHAFRLPQEPLLWQPLFVGTLFAVTLWIWHHPVLYQAALRDPLLHDAQHLSFFLTACLFWRVCLDPLGQRRLSPPAAVPYLFATSIHSSALGIFLALSPHVWYGHYESRTPAWGFTPLEDQQLAGLWMWMPGCLMYPAVAAMLVSTWLAGLAETSQQRSRAQRTETWGE